MVREGANSGIATSVIYDVFLSFRGPDTRMGFTSILYEIMKKWREIHIFKDDEELPEGKKISEILQAIETSKIYIPILSKGYAASKWCLRELTKIVQCTDQFRGRVILPIFYDVDPSDVMPETKQDPSDVMLETKQYESALKEHEKELGCAAVEPWRQALTTVAGINGWYLKNQDQGKAIGGIVERVLEIITTRKRDLPANLVGISDRIEDIKKSLHCCDTSDVRFVIIHGFSGTGKTILANAIFNEVYPLFEGCCFLSDIQESSSPCCGNVKMQRKLAEDLFNYSLPETFDFEEGNNKIKKILPCRKVLIVFDGLDGNDKFMQLVKHCILCRPGSRIIVTTRDKSTFRKTIGEGLEENIYSKKIILYEMREMHSDHALLLFNKLAFKTDVAPCDLHDLSREAVALAGGHPLAIKEISSHFHITRKEMWKSTLMKLKEVPLNNVQQRLKIDYDALEPDAQKFFLDIAFFFVNKKITDAMYMWKACQLFPKNEIDVLLDKSLIRVVGHERVSMQNPLRDCGREIVRRENENYEERSRLWSPEKALQMVLAKKGTKKVVALKLQRSRDNFTRKHFANLMNVKFLELDGGNFVGNFKDIFSDLIWLCWRNCPPKLQANDFVLNCLVVLKLSGDFTTEHWSGWVKIMVARNLKVLKLAGSKSLIKIPHFPKLVSLERLILKDFPSLAEIDCSINQLEGLTYLKIKKCQSLKELPQAIGCLTKLRELILIQGFSVRYLPDSIGNLRLLSRLVMEDTAVIKLPDTIKGLRNLQYLCLAYCSSLYSLPDAFGELNSLTELDLSGTRIRKLPQSLCNLKDLKLRIKKSSIKARRMGDLLRLEDIEDC